jgi:hypothetical protein
MGHASGCKGGILAGAKWQEERQSVKEGLKLIEIIHEN